MSNKKYYVYVPPLKKKINKNNCPTRGMIMKRWSLGKQEPKNYSQATEQGNLTVDV